MADRDSDFVQRHPRLSAGVSLLGVATMILGASGIPSDIENWGKAFAWLGSEGGRWMLAVLGFLAVVVTTVAPRLSERWKRYKSALPSDARKTRKSTRENEAQQQAFRERRFHRRREEKRLDRLKRDVQAELVVAIDQGKALLPDAYSSVEFAPFEFWRKRAVMFVETVFGPLERQRVPHPDNRTLG